MGVHAIIVIKNEKNEYYNILIIDGIVFYFELQIT